MKILVTKRKTHSNSHHFPLKVSPADVSCRMSLCVRITFSIFVTGLVFEKLAIAQQCNGPRQLPIHDMMLEGHTYKKLYARSGDAECLFICRNETLCQSFNFVKNQSICEFNNRTKEASPENFVVNNERYYVKLDVSRGKHFVFLTLFFFLHIYKQMNPRERSTWGIFFLETSTFTLCKDRILVKKRTFYSWICLLGNSEPNNTCNNNAANRAPFCLRHLRILTKITVHIFVWFNPVRIDLFVILFFP